MTQAAGLLRGEELVAFADAGYQGMVKREELRDNKVQWQVALRPGKRRALNPRHEADRLLE